jgi:SAM-dependent methyltransferase
MANLLSDIDKYMSKLGEEEKATRAAIAAAGAGRSSLAVVRAEALEEEEDDGLYGADENGVTPSMKFQDEVGKLRAFLGYDVERGGGIRVFNTGDAVVVTERRKDGAQTYLRLAGGGWVCEMSPSSFEPLCTIQKQLPGGYPPMSNVLNPDPKTSAAQTFLAAIDYRQMNGLALDFEEDSVDCVLVKGTLDSFLAKGMAGRNDALVLLEQIYACLKPTGKFICISHAGEHPDLLNRLVLLKEDLGGFKWSVETRALSNPHYPGQFHKAYICSPRPIKAGEIWDTEEAQSAVVT